MTLGESLHVHIFCLSRTTQAPITTAYRTTQRPYHPTTHVNPFNPFNPSTGTDPEFYQKPFIFKY